MNCLQYTKHDINLKSLNCIKKFNREELKDILAEVFDLIQLICTLPSIGALFERSFSTMNRIKTITRRSQSEDSMPTLFLISMEKI